MSSSVLGRILEAADGDFNVLLELGFACLDPREWEWRRRAANPCDQPAGLRAPHRQRVVADPGEPLPEQYRPGHARAPKGEPSGPPAWDAVRNWGHEHAAPNPDAPRRERLERLQPVHRLGRRRPHRQGPRRSGPGGRTLVEHDVLPDDAVHLPLRRAITTAQIALDAADRLDPGRARWRLNERHYGALQGLNKAETKAKYGDEQFMLWRRSYDTPPPPIDPATEYSQTDDPRYADLRRSAADRVPKKTSSCASSCTTGETIAADLTRGQDRFGRRAR